MAPSDIIWAFPNGKLTIGPEQYSNTGQWNIFVPGNHQKVQGGKYEVTTIRLL